MVVRYAIYLVGREIYKCVELIFLVCGHTQHVCDHIFKEFKQKFRHKTFSTIVQLLGVLNYSPQVNAVCVPSEIHFDWGNYLDKLCKRPGAETVTKIIFLQQN